jgi:sugar-phosphatase
MSEDRLLTCRALLFDLDGTLIDSSARIRRLWQWWAARHGIEYESLVGIILGRTAVETIQIVAPQLVAEREIDALETEEVSDMHDVTAYPGALDLLKRLDGAPWAIVTSGSARVANARIRHVALPQPPVLITADQIQYGKPAPEPYLLAASQLGVKPQDCVVVEDAPVGLAAGKAAGMRVVAIASTHPREELKDADAVVGSLGSIDLHADGATILLRIQE